MNLSTIKFSLKSKIALAISILVVSVMFIVMRTFTSKMENELNESLSTQQEVLVSRIVGEIEEQLELKRKAIVGLADGMNEVVFNDPILLQNYITENLTAKLIFPRAILVLDAKGHLIAENPDFRRRGIDISYREYFSEVARTKKVAIAPPIISTKDNKPVLVVSAPIFSKNREFIGVIAGAIDLTLPQTLIGNLYQVRLGETGYLYLVTKQRYVLMHPDRDRLLKLIAPRGVNLLLDKALDEGFEGTGQTINSYGQHMLVTFKHIKNTDWILGANYPIDEAFAPIYHLKEYTFYLGIVMTIAILVAIWLLIWYFLSPLELLTAKINQIKTSLNRKDLKKELLFFHFQTKDEINTLAVAFNTLLHHLIEREHQLHTSEQTLREITASLGEGLYVINEHGIINYVNPEATKILCYAEYEFLNQNAHELFHHASDSDGMLSENCCIRRVTTHGNTYRSLDELFLHKTGRVIPVSIVATPMFRQGHIVGTVVAFQDITEFKLLQQRLKQTNAELETILQTLSIGVVMTINRKYVRGNSKFSELTGYSDEEFYNQDIRRIYPMNEKGENIYDAIGKIGYEEMRKNNIYRTELELINRGKGCFWASLQGSPVDKQDLSKGVIWIIEDITERKRIEDNLRLAANIIEHMPSGVIITDKEGVIQKVNPAYSSLTGFAPEEVIGYKANIFNPHAHEEHVFNDLWENVDRFGYWRGEFYDTRKNGEVFPEHLSLVVIYDKNHECTHYAMIFNDISEQKHYEEMIHYQAYHDALTGLPNRLAFNQSLQQIIEESKKNERVFALMFLDLNKFKHINDTFGHDVGDLVLKTVAHRLKQCIAEEHIISRLAGDEFTIILRDLENIQQGLDAANSILTCFLPPARLTNHLVIQLQTSIGVSFFPSDAQDAENLLKKADEAMYLAKQNKAGFKCANANYLLTDNGKNE